MQSSSVLLRFMKSLILLFTALLIIPTARAGAEDAAPRMWAEQFFTGFIRGDTDNAYAKLFAGSLAEQDPAKLEEGKRRLQGPLRYGKPLGYELVIENSSAHLSCVLFTFLRWNSIP